jgi:hypothetical protein
MAKNQKIKVVQPDEEIPTEILAEAIVKLSAVGKTLKGSRLKKHTILLLLKDATKIPFHEIEKILDALPELERLYLK